MTRARDPHARWLPRLVWLCAVAAALLVVGLPGLGVLNARAVPLVRSETIALPGWLAGAPPIRVVLLSDIHLGNVAMDPRRLGRVVAQINGLEPDLVLAVGDFLVGHAPSGAAARAAALTGPLVGLRAPLGVVAVLGNHDYWTSRQGVVAALEKAGVRVLDNRAMRLGPIVVAGVGDAISDHDRPAPTLEAARRLAGTIVVLTHSPDLSPRLPSDVHLVLAGHTHCGQIVLPGGRPLSTRGASGSTIRDTDAASSAIPDACSWSRRASAPEPFPSGLARRRISGCLAWGRSKRSLRRWPRRGFRPNPSRVWGPLHDERAWFDRLPAVAPRHD